MHDPGELRASKPEDIDTRSLISMQELDPSPVDDLSPDPESGEYLPKPLDDELLGREVPESKFSGFNLGLRGYRWDSWLSTIQKYSTYPPTLFFTLHIANTSLIPLVTSSVSSSESFLLLTRPIYQSPSLEHIVLTVPVLAHIVSGIVLRNIRASRRARLYGAETRAQRHLLTFWPKVNLQARLGYVLVPLLGIHVLVNRVVPLVVEGGSSGVGLGYVAHGFARSPLLWNIYYLLFVAAGVWHFVGGWAAWMGWRVTTARQERGRNKGSLGGYLGFVESQERVKRRKRMWWMVNGIAALGTSIWLAGALGVIGRGGEGFGWEAENWNVLYKSVPVIGDWLCFAAFESMSLALRIPVFHLTVRRTVRPISRSSRSDVPWFAHRQRCRTPSLFTRPYTPTPLVMAQSKEAKTIGQLVQHNGKEYRAIQEGLACILNPPSQEAASQAPPRKNGAGEEELQSVFYNPIQQFNRDLSVLAIRAFGEHVLVVKKQKASKQKARHEGWSKGKKRKRTDGEEPQESNSQVPQKGEETDQPHSEQTPAPQSFTILDALSATGLRALRYASEIPFTSCVVANDWSPTAIQSMKMNIEYNGLETRISPNVGDARVYMHSSSNNPPNSNSSGPAHTGKFDVIDLDPYGTAAPFLDAAVQGVKDGGLLCVTCTDAGVWASAGYPEKAFALYGGVPLKGSHCHEGGLRLILHSIATAAAKYGVAIEPLLSLSIDFYARVFVRVHKSPAAVKFISGNTMLVYNCDSGCGAWTTQPLTQTRQKADKQGKPFYHYGLAQAPVSGPYCEHCGFKTHLGGPMWAGPMHNPHFIQKILDMLPNTDRTVYQTVDRIEGMLTTALEEDLNLASLPEATGGDEQAPDTIEATTATVPTAADPTDLAIIPRMDPAAKEPYPFYFNLSYISKVIHCSTISVDAFRGALGHLGYRCSRSHARPNTIRTDAPWEVVWEVMREWVRQKSPIRENALKPGTPGAAIMAKRRENLRKADAAAAAAADDTTTSGEDPCLSLLKTEVLSALEAGKDVTDLITKIEAALYRSGARKTAPASNPRGSGESEKTQQSTEPQSQLPASTPQPTLKPHPSTLDVVFDEALGKQTAVKRLVRYQINPRANWGPLSRATGSNQS
ncbi:hypothetical protein ASPZODRAFT_153176 [Penicilliopsis zonata CBS 506.65]|uniref:tRNA (guanine(26)-N(2))-dimethyltransferase n=1 Tax=Penicilliopsis zonata CBS 506.65 TaxID=1073090 RepID=A0A1L9SE73_9EURO|nr:hypothetical protein ASPZODRAFT_153176 [Penicilliopsis zonata CBS 506.65]OJJ45530.1 hypothetical protein ASPZODRAFT_153176 [Penicilliopsis zonata CBS 506.65]